MKKLFSNINLSFITDLPTPLNISYMWNLGSFLGTVMVIQVVSGLFLVFYYSPSENEAFLSMVSMMREAKFGFLIRFIHLNFASLVFISIYCHMWKGLLNNSFLLKASWLSGNMILLLTILVAFMGYVLPWGNMGFWAATVITSFISAIPFLGQNLLNWIWGGFSITEQTLKFFFTMHFFLPLVILALALIHIMLLHNNGSSNPLGSSSFMIKVKFYPFFTSKDLMNFAILVMFLWLILIFPLWSSDPDNFINANRLMSPVNIQPEWYFLPFYALLRSSNSKLGGLVLMILGIVMFWFMPYFIIQDLKKFKLYNYLNFYLLMLVIFLGWIASWSADSYMSNWLMWIVPMYYMWWFMIWAMSILIDIIFNY